MSVCPDCKKRIGTALSIGMKSSEASSAAASIARSDLRQLQSPNGWTVEKPHFAPAAALMQ
jgi:hypothetical protein